MIELISLPDVNQQNVTKTKQNKTNNTKQHKTKQNKTQKKKKKKKTNNTTCVQGQIQDLHKEGTECQNWLI